MKIGMKGQSKYRVAISVGETVYLWILSTPLCLESIDV